MVVRRTTDREPELNPLPGADAKVKASSFLRALLLRYPLSGRVSQKMSTLELASFVGRPPCFVCSVSNPVQAPIMASTVLNLDRVGGDGFISLVRNIY